MNTLYYYTLLYYTICIVGTNIKGNFFFFYSNPYNPICLAPYGGPVDPSVALGGFSNSSEPITKMSPYEKATSLLLTFVLNNHNSKPLLKDALEWENKYSNLYYVVHFQ